MLGLCHRDKTDDVLLGVKKTKLELKSNKTRVKQEVSNCLQDLLDAFKQRKIAVIM